MIYCHVEEGIVGLRASTLDEAIDLADGLAIVSHVEECNDDCKQWVTY
jgi:hypothetical protein